MGQIKLKVNGVEYSVGSDVSSDVTLLDYLRDRIGLRGTKYMCREGGCGGCVVNAKSPSAAPFAINSCMRSVTSCHGWEITTIEGLGNRQKGYHVLQTTLAEKNGSQCGYCSPSWVMAMYSLLQANPNITMLEVEKSLGSQTCRCTGYRPILEAFKTFAKDAPRPIKLQDIEDVQICKKNGGTCDKGYCEDSEWCFVDHEDKEDVIEIKLKDNRLWVRALEVTDIFKILKREGDDSYMLICGNTAKGVYPIEEYPRVLIDISGVKELKGYILDQNLIVKAGTTLTEFLEILKTVAKEEYFGYLQKIYDHVQKVAHIPVRNVASIAGNLMIKHQNKWFPSDIFLLLETIGAQVTIQKRFKSKETLSMQQFLEVNMKGAVIWNVMLPPLGNHCRIITYKVMPRSENAHALVNAGFMYKLKTGNIVESARIVYGALSPSFIRANATEKFLKGKKLFNNKTLTSAIKILEAELVVEDNPPDPSVEYRKQVALGLFYKGLLSLSPETNLNARYKSGATNLADTRPVSRAIQEFDTNQTVWPVNQPIKKVEAVIQCAGEAFYTEDLPHLSNEVYCALVLSTVALGDIVSIDACKALALPGVIAFYTAEDIPGLNSFTTIDSFLYSANEEVLASGTVKYFNQPIGIVVAESRYLADKAAKLVETTYVNVKEPLIDVKKTIDDKNRTTQFQNIEATETGSDVDKVIKGLNSVYGQYHYTMETLTTVVKPSDEGFDVYCATQWIESVQLMISRALKINQNQVDVHTRCVGGSYGMKFSRSTQGAIAAALVVQKLNRPCRFIQSLTTNTKALGKRLPCCSDFEAGVSSTGAIQYINCRVFEDNGYKINEQFTLFGIGQFNNAYNRARWNYTSFDSITDTAKNTWARSPGTLEHVAMSELIMEQIAYEMNLDPVDVRMANLDQQYRKDMKEMIDYVMIKSDYPKRREAVNKFNTENRWKKRGLRFSFMRWTPVGGVNLYISLSVYRGDGSVIITHGATEMGQGINTKAVQVAAYMLKIPIEKIIVKENNTVIAANSSGSGGSVMNQNVIVGVQRACQQLLDRLKPVRDAMDNPTWEELITKAYNDNVNLQAHGFTRTDEEYPFIIYGVTLAEVELDVLTGQFELLRVDLCEDVGQSVSPEIDIGQVEGAFMMGVGYWTCENLVYAPTGELLTDRSWNYHVPLARDIPQDWRVYFRKNSYSADSIFGSKCIGEPPICMAVVVALAIREAITAARLDSGIPKTQWFAEVGCDVSSDVMLVDYLRLYIGLHGTKYMCREGGCGACIVSVQRDSGKPYAINSCMKPVTACHGLEITTIEGLGNRKKGYHELQTTLASENGTQCGYCSPSWVMSMYSLLQTNPNITMLEIEKSLASNVCRCTGYRPILDAFKKFAIDAPRQIKIRDIEDLQICKKTGEACDKSSCEDSEWCFVDQAIGKGNIIEIELKDKRLWYRVQVVSDIFSILNREGDDSYMLVNGNTARGVYPIDEYPRVLIDISGVKELKGYTVDQNLIVNAGTTLTEFLEILRIVSKEEYFGYLQKIYDHVLNVAHIPIRNVASIAGNLMIKNQHNWFASDIFLLLETVGAQVTIQNSFGAKQTLTMQQFLKVNMRGYVIWNIMLPPLCNNHRLVTYKVMPRSQNAKALIHAGFLYQLTNASIVKSVRIVYGALSPKFIHANATEKFLIGKKLFTNETLTAAIKILQAELVVEDNPPEPSVQYRKKVAVGLFYKGLLSLSPETNLHARYKSGATVLSDTRPVSRGVQVFETNRTVWPVTQPIMKVEALIQCAGEAFYVDDLPHYPNEVFCALALSTVALGDIVSIDASKALAFPGVLAFYTAEDIPGLNSFTPTDSFLYSANEEVLASGTVKYFNQPIGIVVAETRYIADRAAKLVEATYANVTEPLLDVRQTIDNSNRSTQFTQIEATDRGTEVVAKEIKGVNSIYGQYHFTIETLTTVVKPSDEGLDVYCATQWMEGVQLMISRALKINQNQVDVHTRRVGGAYGIKLTRSSQGAIAAALVVQKLNRPCRFIQSLTTNTKALGKRLPCCSDFEAGISSTGAIQYINYRVFEDNGYKINEQFTLLGVEQFNNAYNRARWNYTSFDSITDTAKNTWARSPGTLEHVAMSEFIMEQIAYEMNLDPVDVRIANLDQQHRKDMKEMIDYVMIKSDYPKRREAVNKFNTENRWKKRGLRFSFVRWTPVGGLNLYISLSVYRGDGSVVITHGAIEMGQGINTKAVQVAAYMLKIPIEKIIVKENNTVIAPNCTGSGSSIVNQNVIVGVQRACQQLLDRLKPVRDAMDNPTWEELITKAYNDNVNLQAHGFTRSDEEYPFIIYGVTLAEVELDVLTGEFELLRVDLCEDAGQSVSPEIDIGQVEGAFLMGVGYWTCENLVYASTGELLTDRSWNYHVPLARDIPQDWRVYFRKNSYSADSVLGSKCIGEPPICMAVVVAFAIREAITAARLDSGIPKTQWFAEDGPYTVERNYLLSSTNTADFKFN